MTKTIFQRTAVLGKPLIKTNANKVIASANWVVVASWSIRPLSTQLNWRATVDVDAWVDAGVTAEMRVRTSTGHLSPTFAFTGPIIRATPGWAYTPNTEVRVFLETRITAGTGGVRYTRADAMGMSAPPGQTNPTATPVPTVIGTFSGTTVTTAHTVTVGSFSAAPAAGDRVMFIYGAPSPSVAASITYTHAGFTLLTDVPGSGVFPRIRVVSITYAAQASFALSANQNVRLAGIIIRTSSAVTASAPSYALSPVSPPGVTNTDRNLLMPITVLATNGGTVTEFPPDHTSRINMAAGVQTIHVSSMLSLLAGNYDPPAALVTPANVNATATTLAIAP